MSDPSRPLINIPVPGPVLLLDLFPHTFFCVVIVLVDYYLCCRTSMPYAKFKPWYVTFHLLLPFLIGPTNHGLTTPFTVAPWFVASVGAFCSQKYKHQQLKDETIPSSPQPLLSWLKSIGVEGFALKSDQQPNGTTLTHGQVRREGLIRFVGVIFVMTVGSLFLTPFLLEDYNEFFTFPWYSTQCIYYGFLMGLKGYTLMISNDILSSIIQMVTGYRILAVFNRPFLATSPKDFWGNRWNLMMRHLLRKQVYVGVKPNDTEANVSLKRLRAFFISALMHETIMTIVNRGITMEQFCFFMIQGVAVYLQRMVPVPKYVADKTPRIASIVLTMVFLSLTSKLFLCPFLRFESQALLFTQKSFI